MHVCFVFLFRFRFRLYAFIEAAALRSIVRLCMRLDSHTRLPNNCLRPFLFLLLSFLSFFGDDVAFSEYLCTTIAVFSY